jgi:pimeloyl-ACP methyl ester carboxylesterase
MTRVADAAFDTEPHHRFVRADGVDVFSREAGDPAAPVILLLHGFGASSHQFRKLMPILSRHFRLIAPDLPGFGFTQVPAGRGYVYSFDALAETMAGFVAALGLTRYIIYIFDYGAPVGLRLALKAPEAVAGLITQNGNAYEEGLSEAWLPVRAFWADNSPASREAIDKAIFSREGLRWQYEHGVADTSLIAPETYHLAADFIEQPGNREIQLDLTYDYQNNVRLYPAFQAFFRARRPKTLAIWGANDPFFLPAGAEAFRRDNPEAVVEFLDTGHFALETHSGHIGRRIVEVFGQV